MQSVYYNNLGANKRIYDAALKCLQNRGKTLSIVGVIKADELYKTVLDEHPELFYVSQEFYIKTGLIHKEIEPIYLYSTAEIKKMHTQLEIEVQKILSECINEHQADYDKARSLHDYLKSNLEYDDDATGKKKFKSQNFIEAHNIIGALLKHKCVCEGFAKAFKFLCDKIGLECWVVSGTGGSTISSGPHAWNIVKINGYYHHVDVTWDNQYSDSSRMPNYGYLNLSDDEITKDHTWNRKNYPKCPSSPYNYFRVNNALIDSKAQLETMLYNSFQMEEEIIMFRVVRGSILEQEISGCLKECIQRAANRCKYISVPKFNSSRIPEQLTFCVRPEYCYK